MKDAMAKPYLLVQMAHGDVLCATLKFSSGVLLRKILKELKDMNEKLDERTKD